MDLRRQPRTAAPPLPARLAVPAAELLPGVGRRLIAGTGETARNTGEAGTYSQFTAGRGRAGRGEEIPLRQVVVEPPGAAAAQLRGALVS